MLQPYFCAWCGTRLPDRTGGRGQPRQTCGASKCRRLNATYVRQQRDKAFPAAAAAVEAAEQLAELRQHVEDAHRHAQRLLSLVAWTLDDFDGIKESHRLRYLHERLQDRIRPEAAALWDRLWEMRRL